MLALLCCIISICICACSGRAATASSALRPSLHWSVRDRFVLRSGRPSAHASIDSRGGNAKRVVWKMLRLLAPVGYGQPSTEESGFLAGMQTHTKKRKLFTDKQMTTHVFFFVSIAISYTYNVFELALLMSTTTALSIAYHYNYERPGPVALMEGLFAKSLFLYGTLQLTRAKATPGGTPLLIAEIALMTITIATFFVTNLNRKSYETFHCFMHIFPSIWCGFVGYFHDPFFF